MASLSFSLTPADHLAALAAWVASPSGGSTTSPHVMDTTTTPIIQPNGGVIVHLNS